MTNRVCTAQELTLLQVSAEQSCGGVQRCAAGAARCVNATLPPLTAARGVATATSMPVASGTTSLAHAEVTNTGTLVAPFAQRQQQPSPPPPGGSSSTVPAAIVRPSIHDRRVWDDVLRDVAPFTLPSTCIRTRVNDAVVVRYSADAHDRAWVARCGARADGDKGGMRSDAPAAGVGRGEVTHDSTTTSPARLRCVHDVCALEEIVSALEMLVYDYPEVPPHRLRARDAAQRTALSRVSDAFVEVVKEYWLRKRHALGGRMPCIAELRGQVTEANEHALCRAAVLGDCPLPFKVRDWAPPVLCRAGNLPAAPLHRRVDGACAVKRTRGGDDDGDDASRADTSAARDVVDCGSSRPDALVASALHLSRCMLRRELLHLQHTCMTMYELALLRRLGSAPAPCADANVASAGRDDAASLSTGQAAVACRTGTHAEVRDDDVAVGDLALLRALHCGTSRHV